MRKLVLYICTSADGYIARKNGSIDWLPAPDPDGVDYGYGKFVKTVDTILWGRKTYEQALTFGPFPDKSQAGKKHYVFSRKKKLPARPRPPGLQFVSSDPVALVRRLKKQKGSAIWLMGGARLIAPLHQAGLIDEYIITVCPVFLGMGIPLFLKNKREQTLRLIESQSFDKGLVQLHYQKSPTGAKRKDTDISMPDRNEVGLDALG